jgi:hypothetical protein
VNATTGPAVPELDAARIGRLRHVLAGGKYAHDDDELLAGQVLGRYPWLAALTAGANEFGRRAALWAVTGGTPDFPVPPAAWVIFAASSYPLDGGLHAAAKAARPLALFGYADADELAVAYTRALLAAPDPLRVRAYKASARDPAGLLGAFPAPAMLDHPGHVQLQMCAHWWPGDFAAWAVAEYGRLLRERCPGSTLALSLGIPGGAPGWDAFAADMSLVGGTVHAHTADEVAGWLAAAGLRLTPDGITDVRGKGRGWAADRFSRQQPVARVVEAVAVVP